MEFFTDTEAMRKQLASEFDMQTALHILKCWEYNGDITEEQYNSLWSFVTEEVEYENISN